MTDYDNSPSRNVSHYVLNLFCDGKLWFGTNKTKEVDKDTLANPNVEVSVSGPSYEWMCLSGEAANPIFEVFYLKNAHAAIAGFSGNPPREYDL